MPAYDTLSRIIGEAGQARLQQPPSSSYNILSNVAADYFKNQQAKQEMMQKYIYEMQLQKAKQQAEMNDPINKFLKKVEVAQGLGISVPELDNYLSQGQQEQQTQPAQIQRGTNVNASPMMISQLRGFGTIPNVQAPPQQSNFGQFKSPFITESQTVKPSIMGGKQVTSETQINPLAEQYKQDVKAGSKFREASQKALGNFGRMASAIKLFSNYYADSLKEGGVGDIGKKYLSQAKLKLGGEFGEKLTSTGKLYGQGVEMSLSSIPIMTGQNRFVESLREALKQTYPSGEQGASLAAGMLEQTLENMYMTTKILTRLGIDINNPSAGDEISADETNNILTSVGYNAETKKWNPSNITKLAPEEKEELKNIKQDVLGSLYNMSNSSIPQVGGMFQGQKVIDIQKEEE